MSDEPPYETRDWPPRGEIMTTRIDDRATEGRSLDVIQGVAFPRPAPVDPPHSPAAADGPAAPSPAPMAPPPDFDD